MQFMARKIRKSEIFTGASLTLALIISLVLNQTSVNADTEFNILICNGGETTSSFNIDSPVNNASFDVTPTDITISSDWGYELTIERDSTLIGQQDLIYGEGQTSTIPIELVDGQNNLTVSLRGGCPEDIQTKNLTLNYSDKLVTITHLVTNQPSPRLSGLVKISNAIIKISIAGNSYSAINNGDGTWHLPEGIISPDLLDNEYDVMLVLEDNLGNQLYSNLAQNSVIIDSVAPTGTITSPASSTSRSPEIKGTINDIASMATINVNGKSYSAIINPDGTWVLPSGTISELASGIYDLEVIFRDLAGNFSTKNQTLTISATGEIGFIIPPNTGYLRVFRLNIPSWFIYISILALGFRQLNKQSSKIQSKKQ